MPRRLVNVECQHGDGGERNGGCDVIGTVCWLLEALLEDGDLNWLQSAYCTSRPQSGTCIPMIWLLKTS